MNRIRAARQARAWTQSELAGRARVSPRTIHAVEKGQVVAVMEAMKMEHALEAPRDGVVEAIGIDIGAQVPEGEVLVALEAAD